MSSPNVRIIHDGILEGALYDFDEGDEIPEHTHGDGDKHYTIVLLGSVEVSGPWGTQTLRAGGMMKFKVGQPHAIRALEDGTRIFNPRY